MAMKYRKKPVVVEAIQWTGKNLQELKNFVGDSLEYDVMDAAWEVGKGPVIVNVRIQTLEGIHHASVGDFIIKGIRGEFYPCKPDIFAKTYESASLTPPNEWVSVYDRLPEPGERVLATDCGFVGEFYINKRGKWQRYNVNCSELLMALDILYWMPLPAPPDRRPPEGRKENIDCETD